MSWTCSKLTSDIVLVCLVKILNRLSRVFFKNIQSFYPCCEVDAKADQQFGSWQFFCLISVKHSNLIYILVLVKDVQENDIAKVDSLSDKNFSWLSLRLIAGVQPWEATMPKCDFNKHALQLYWNHTSAWVFSCRLAACFQNPFS